MKTQLFGIVMVREKTGFKSEWLRYGSGEAMVWASREHAESYRDDLQANYAGPWDHLLVCPFNGGELPKFTTLEVMP